MNYENHLRWSYDLARHSPDPSTQNGAVLVDAKLDIIIGEGWNDFPSGVSSAYWYGAKEDKYNRVVHAEMAAIIDAARAGSCTVNTTLVCAWAACSNCAKHIAAAGIKRLVRHSYSNNGADTGSHWYADCRLGDEIMTEAGVEIVEIDPLDPDSLNFKLRRNGHLWPEKETSVQHV